MNFSRLYTHKSLVQGVVGAIGNNKMSYCKCKEEIAMMGLFLESKANLSLSLSKQFSLIQTQAYLKAIGRRISDI